MSKAELKRQIMRLCKQGMGRKHQDRPQQHARGFFCSGDRSVVGTQPFSGDSPPNQAPKYPA
jgi:hypothetical protein